MIRTDRELQATVDRIAHVRRQVERLRAAEIDPTSYHLSAEGFLAEIDRMNLEVREYLAVTRARYAPRSNARSRPRRARYPSRLPAAEIAYYREERR